MAYERVQKRFGQSSSKKKHTPIVPPLNEEPTQADSQLSPKVKPSRIPSKEERDAIRRKIFDSIRQSGENQTIMREGLFRPTVRVQEAPDFLSVARTLIQAKLTIGEPGDKYEQEADRVAAQVVNQINAPCTHQSDSNLQREEASTLDELQMKSEVEAIQREAMPVEEEEVRMKPMVQLQAGDGGLTTTPDLESSIQQARSGGQPLADNIIEPMEQAFGADFSGVKVHTDAQADQLNRAIQAKAFTTRQDVFFRQGEYNPGSRGGQELIAHELTHVVQQNGEAVQRACLQIVSSLPQGTETSNPSREMWVNKQEDAALLSEGAYPSYVASAIPGGQKSPTGHSEQEPLVVQRVTYKETKYDPGVKEEQDNFLVEAEKDLKAKKAWAEGRSKRLVTALGLTNDVIPTVEDLILKEKEKWQVFDKAIEKDIQEIDQPLQMIEAAAKTLSETLPKLKTDEKSVTDINKCLDLLREARKLIPDKMRLREEKTLSSVNDSLAKYIEAKPWEAEIERQKLEEEKKQAYEKISNDLDVEKSQNDEKTQEKIINRKKKNVDKFFEKKFKKINSITKLEDVAKQEVATLAGIPVAIPDSLRKSAEEQFGRGQMGYRFDKDKKTDLNKIYIGQIEDTEKTKDTGEKGRGVLWATPWAPGVNVAYIEGGIAKNQVFKLRTDIPKDLISDLEKGDIESFKSKVKGQSDKKYWPFWHGLENRFTQFTVELETLTDDGYKLRQFKRKSNMLQQVMAKDEHMHALNEYYNPSST